MENVIDRAKRVLRGRKSFELLGGIRHRRQSYSQFGEDAFLLSYYDRLKFRTGSDIKTGWVVDVGAYRPVAQSNTYAFYRKGWRCINIDPTPGFKAMFDAVRPKDVNLQVAIAAEPGEAEFFLFGQPSVYNTMDRQFATEIEAQTGQKPRIEPVVVTRLDTILDSQGVSTEFELLCIDAEGLDIDILRSNDFGKYRPRVVLIEVHGFSLGEAISHPVVEFMADHDYGLFSWIRPNLMFVRSDSVV